MAADRPAPRDGRKRAVVVHSYGDSERGIFVTGRLLACGYAVVPARGSGSTALDEATASFPGLPIAHLGQPRDVRALARAAASLRRRVSALASIGEPLGLLLDEADGLAVPTLVVADSATWGMRRRVRRALPRGSRVVRAGDFEAALLAAIGFFDEWAYGGLRPRTAPRRSARRLAPAALLAAPSTLLMAAPAAQAAPTLASFEDVVKLIAEKRDIGLRLDVEQYVRPISFRPGAITFEAAPGAPGNLAGRLVRALKEWTGQPWLVAAEGGGGAESLLERQKREEKEQMAAIRSDPFVASVLDAFPGAEIVEVRTIMTPEAPPIEPDELEET